MREMVAAGLEAARDARVLSLALQRVARELPQCLDAEGHRALERIVADAQATIIEEWAE